MRPPSIHVASAAVAGTLALLVGSCAAPRKPAPRPPLRVEVQHFSGSVLTGPMAEQPDTAPAASALGLAVRVAVLASAPAGQPLPVRLVVADGLPTPFRTRSELALGARLTTGTEGLMPVLWESARSEALVPGGTTVLVVEPETDLPDAPRPAWERLEIEVSRRHDDQSEIELALGLSGLVSLRVDEEDALPAEDEPARSATQVVRVQEHVVLQTTPRPNDAALGLALPAPTPAEPDAVVLVLLQVLPQADPGAAERAREGVDSARRAAAERAAGLSGAEDFRIGSLSALEALARRELGRPALLYLAGETGAELVGELALIADIEALADLLAEARERIATLPGSTIEPQALGWLLESTAWRWLAARGGDDGREAPLAPELEALLLQRAGEAGRWTDLLVDAVDESESVAALGQRLVQENRIFLEDADPAARLRAFDWLDARGLAPEGFDPLASAAERRAALARLEELELGDDDPEDPR